MFPHELNSTFFSRLLFVSLFLAAYVSLLSYRKKNKYFVKLIHIIFICGAFSYPFNVVFYFSSNVEEIISIFFFNIKRMIKFISPHSFSLANSLLGPFVRSTYVPLIDTVDFWLHIVMMMTHFICTRGLKIEISLCEHIVDACARVVQQFKRLACPELQSITRIKQNICVFFILHVYECNAMNSKQNLHFQWMAIINLCLSWVVSVCVYTRLYVSHSLALFLSLTLTLTLTVNPHVFWTLMRSWIYWLDKSIKGVLWIDSFFWGAIKLLDWIIIYP